MAGARAGGGKAGALYQPGQPDRCDQAQGAGNVPIRLVGASKYWTSFLPFFSLSSLNPKIWRSKLTWNVKCKM